MTTDHAGAERTKASTKMVHLENLVTLRLVDIRVRPKLRARYKNVPPQSSPIRGRGLQGEDTRKGPPEGDRPAEGVARIESGSCETVPV